MTKVFDMGRDELTNFLQKLDNDFNRYAYLYTVLEGNLILQNISIRLKKNFGKSLADYEHNALAIMNNDPEATVLTGKVEAAEKKCKRLRHLTKTYRPGLIKKINRKPIWITIAIVGVLSAVTALPLAIFFAIFIGYLYYMAAHANKFVSDFEKAKQQYSDLYNQLHDMLIAKESELWQKNFEKFCSIPENRKLIDQAIESTKQQLNEFNTLDFSKYSYLPSMYQDNQSVHNSLQFLLTDQAMTWQECAQLLSQREFQERQLKEAQAQRQNQAQIINNQQQMIKNQQEALANQQQIIENQQTQIYTMNEINQNIQNVNEKIKEVKNDIKRHSLIQEVQMTEMIHKQSQQIFQQQQFHREQLNEMRKSINSTASSPSYTQVSVAPVG